MGQSIAARLLQQACSAQVESVEQMRKVLPA